MAERQSSNPTASPSVALVAFEPTPTQREVKARFWARANENPLIDAATLSVARAAEIAQSSSLTGWMSNPNFAAWFRNRDAARHQIEAGVEVAVQRLVEILRSTDVGPKGTVTAAAQVNAAKLLLEYAGYAPPSRREVTFQDKSVAAMDETQLRAYIAANTRQLSATDEDPNGGHT